MHYSSLCLIGTVFITFNIGFVNLCGIKRAIELVHGDYVDPKSHGEFSCFSIPLAFAALLFAFSTMISWSRL